MQLVVNAITAAGALAVGYSTTQIPSGVFEGQKRDRNISAPLAYRKHDNYVSNFFAHISTLAVTDSRFTWTGGSASGTYGWYPNSDYYPACYIRDFAMTVRGAPWMFTSTDITNCIGEFIFHQKVTGELADGVYPDGMQIVGPRFYGYDNPAEFVDLIYSCYLKDGNATVLNAFSNETWKAMNSLTVTNNLVGIHYDQIGFGFQDTAYSEGYELYTSVIRYRALTQLAAMGWSIDTEQAAITESLATNLWDDSFGMFRNASVTNTQHSIPGNALVIRYGLCSSDKALRIAQRLASWLPGRAAYTNTVVYNGAPRHLPPGNFWSYTTSTPGTYQNGPYWPTFTGWVADALNLVAPVQAEALINNLFTNYWNANQAQVPLEHYNADSTYHRYCTSITIPMEYIRLRDTE